MSDPKPALPGECPGCGTELSEEDKDPLMGLFLCDECEIGYNKHGVEVAK